MGMAASQARLLSLTGLLADSVQKEQTTMREKLSLTSAEDAAYERYNAALDAEKIQIGIPNETGRLEYIDATFATTCEYMEGRANQYAMIDNKNGKVLVSRDAFNAWDRYGNDKYAFAWAMLDNDGRIPNDNSQIGIGTATAPSQLGTTIDGNYYSFGSDEADSDGKYNMYMSDAEATVFERNMNTDPDLVDAFLVLKNSENEDVETQRAALATFRDILYRNHSKEIFLEMTNENNSGSSYNRFNNNSNYSNIENELKYYQQLWDLINQRGGCTLIDESCQYGEHGVEWFNNMCNSGQVSLIMLSKDNNTDNSWSVTTVNSSAGMNTLRKTQNEDNLDRIKVEYENTLRTIKRKDDKLTEILNKERTKQDAYKSEMETLKNVIKENVDRTFKTSM